MVYHAQRVFVHSSRGLSKLRDKLRALNLHYNGVCGHQSWQDGDLRDSYLKSHLALESRGLFSTVIWLLHSQLWVITEETVSFTRL